MWYIILLHLKPLYAINPSNTVLWCEFSILDSTSTKMCYLSSFMFCYYWIQTNSVSSMYLILKLFLYHIWVYFLFTFYFLISLKYFSMQKPQFTLMFTADYWQLLGSRVRLANAFGRSCSRIAYHIVYNVLWCVKWMKICWVFFQARNIFEYANSLYQ